MHSHVFLVWIFTSKPRSKMMKSISQSPIWAFKWSSHPVFHLLLILLTALSCIWSSVSSISIDNSCIASHLLVILDNFHGNTLKNLPVFSSLLWWFGRTVAAYHRQFLHWTVVQSMMSMHIFISLKTPAVLPRILASHFVHWKVPIVGKLVEL